MGFYVLERITCLFYIRCVGYPWGDKNIKEAEKKNHKSQLRALCI